MTSVPPAEPRPPPIRRPPDPFVHRHNAAGSISVARKAENHTTSPNGTDELDDRPVKRRKLEQTSPTSVQSITNDTPSNQSSTAPKSVPQIKLVEDFHLLAEWVQNGSTDKNQRTDAEVPLPLPVRPWMVARPPKPVEDPKPTHQSRANVQVPTSPDALQSPIGMPQLVNKKPAGYFPWTGKHPEDILSEINVKQGYSDKPPNPPEKELNTARVSLYNAFKHRSGIDSLSTLFSLVLEAKSKHGLIDSVSTFKPPPRVTLTEAKRKSWISDLANSDVPLRKLSRTIPQGIRGQILLDQCLQSSVPLSRAIWFAKCVGANEIRTLKRKGTTTAAAMGTENKWLREWTTNVEQFVESILSQCGQPSWKSHVQYALRLVTRLYIESLLDRDHYLDWLVKSFSGCSNDHLPFWLMLIHIYKTDLVKFRKRGKRLAESLVKRHTQLSDTAVKAMQPLLEKLQDSIRAFVLLRPLSFLLPDQWQETRKALDSCLRRTVPVERGFLLRLEYVNKRCAGSDGQNNSVKSSPREAVLNLLDTTKVPFNVIELSDELLRSCPDTRLLFVFCLEWSSTKFRYGKSRIYLIVRLMRKWQRQGCDVDSAILDFISTCHQAPTMYDTSALKHVVAELSRSNTFSISKYLQWLTVRGMPRSQSIVCESVAQPNRNDSFTRQKCTDSTQLLMDLSLNKSSDHIINLRNSLLIRAGFRPEVETELIDLLISTLEKDLNTINMATGNYTYEEANLRLLLSSQPWSVKCRISHWLRTYIGTNVRRNIPTTDGKGLLQASNPICLPHFHYIRTALELLDDYAVLADVLQLLSISPDEELLSSLVETVSRHADTFSAIGAFVPLQTRFCQIYMSLRGMRSTMPLLANALIELCSTYPTKVISVKLLQQDLVRGDRGRAIAACSPFSDGIAESLQQAEATFIDDFEAVLQSEPSMNEQTMSRLFVVLTERIEKQQQIKDNEQSLFGFCQLLSRLRLCRRAQGDMLVKIWLFRIIASTSTSTSFGQTLVASLISTGCITVDNIVEGVKEQKPVSQTRKAMLKVIDPWLSSTVSTSEDFSWAYTVNTKWLDFAQRKPADTLNLMTEARGRPVADLDLVMNLVLGGSDMKNVLTPSAFAALNKTVENLLSPNSNSEHDIKTYISTLDSLSAPFVQLQFRLLMQTAKSNSEESKASINADIFAELTKDLDTGHSKFNNGNIAKLLRSIGPELATQFRHQMEENLIELLPKFGQGKTAAFPTMTQDELDKLTLATDRLFEVCTDATSPSPRLMTQICERLSGYLKFLGFTLPGGIGNLSVTSPTSATTPIVPNIAAQLSSPIDSSSQRSRFTPAIVEYLHIMLRLLCLQRSGPVPLNGKTIPSIPPSKQLQTDMVKILTVLATIVTHPSFTTPNTAFSKEEQIRVRECADFALDVMATLVDNITDEARAFCFRILRDKIRDDGNGANQGRDNRLRWLFGSVNSCGSDMRGGEDMGKGLLVVKEGKGIVGEWKPKVWEVLESGSLREGESCIGLGLFGARKV